MTKLEEAQMWERIAWLREQTWKWSAIGFGSLFLAAALVYFGLWLLALPVLVIAPITVTKLSDLEGRGPHQDLSRRLCRLAKTQGMIPPRRSLPTRVRDFWSPRDIDETDFEEKA